MRTYKFVLVDDDIKSVKLVDKFCHQNPLLKVTTIFSDTLEAFEFLEKNDIDLLFL